MLSASFAALMMTVVVAAEPFPRDINGTELIVQAALVELEAPPGEVAYQPSAKLAAAFPAYLFVLAQFPNTPAEELPEPLKPQNLFAVGPDGKAKLLATPQDVLDLFKAAGQPVKTADDAKKAAEAALALEQAKFPDQPFNTPADGLQAKPDGKGGFTASGTSQPTAPPMGAPSGSGPITVNLAFGKKGQPASITTINNYRPPTRRLRPVTPADIAADKPVAEKAAGGPVININSPIINKLLPGHTFFSTPGKEGMGAGVVAVDPNGKPHVLPMFGPLFQYIHQQYGKLKTEPQVRSMATTFLTLATTLFPNQKFDPVQESDVKVKTLDGGGFELMGTVYVTGDKTKRFYTHWFIGPKGAITHWGFYPHGI
jgi:hypothetical protein